MVMNLVPETQITLARCDIERAKLDAFLAVFNEEYQIKEYRAEGNNISIALCKSKAPTKSFMDRLRRREFFVYHLRFEQKDWQKTPQFLDTYSTSKVLSAEIDRYEAIKVAQWMSTKTFIFGELPPRS